MNKNNLTKEEKEKLSSQLEMSKKKASFTATNKAMKKNQKTKK